MNKELKDQIRSLAVSGAFRPLEILANELKTSIQQPIFENEGKFLYESGRTEGQKQGIELFINELNRLAKQ